VTPFDAPPAAAGEPEIAWVSYTAGDPAPRRITADPLAMLFASLGAVVLAVSATIILSFALI